MSWERKQWFKKRKRSWKHEKGEENKINDSDLGDITPGDEREEGGKCQGKSQNGLGWKEHYRSKVLLWIGTLPLEQKMQYQEVAALPEHWKVPVSKYTQFLFKSTQIPTAHFLTFLGWFLLGMWSVLGKWIQRRLKDYLVKISVSLVFCDTASTTTVHCRFPSLKKLMDIFYYFFAVSCWLGGWLGEWMILIPLHLTHY